MLSQLTSHVLDTIEELHTAADGIFTRKVFFVNEKGEGMSIQDMRAHNEAAAATPHSDDVVYLMYALITCQAWLQVSTCAFWTFYTIYIYICMYVYIYICIHVYIYIFVYLHI